MQKLLVDKLVLVVGDRYRKEDLEWAANHIHTSDPTLSPDGVVAEFLDQAEDKDFWVQLHPERLPLKIKPKQRKSHFLSDFKLHEKRLPPLLFRECKHYGYLVVTGFNDEGMLFGQDLRMSRDLLLGTSAYYLKEIDSQGCLETLSFEKSQESNLLGPFCFEFHFSRPSFSEPSELFLPSTPHALSLYELNTLHNPSLFSCFDRYRICDSSGQLRFEWMDGCVATRRPFCLNTNPRLDERYHGFPPFFPYEGALLKQELDEKNQIEGLVLQLKVGFFLHHLERQENDYLRNYEAFFTRLFECLHCMQLKKSAPRGFLFPFKKEIFSDLYPDAPMVFSAQTLTERSQRNPILRHARFTEFFENTPQMVSFNLIGLPFSVQLKSYQISALEFCLFQESQPYGLNDEAFRLGAEPFLFSTPADYSKLEYFVAGVFPVRLELSDEEKVLSFYRTRWDCEQIRRLPSIPLLEFKGSLEPSQYDFNETGVSSQLRLARRGGINAMEMRLGKTYVTLALEVFQRRRSLTTACSFYVVPAGIIGMWMQAFHDFAPHLNVLNCADLGARNKAAAEFALFSHYHIILISFTALAKLPDIFQTHDYSRIVVDEAHSFPRPGTAAFRMLSFLRSNYFWILTGSPFTGKQGIGTLGPMVNLAFGRVLLTAEYEKIDASPALFPEEAKRWRRFLQIAMFCMSSSQHLIQTETEPRMHSGRIHKIRTSENTQFLSMYHSALACAPRNINNSYAVGAHRLSKEDLVFFAQLRRACSGFLDLTKSVTNSPEFGDEKKRDETKTSQNFVVLPLPDEDGECPVCLEVPQVRFQLPCTHIMCQQCLLTMTKNVSSVPCPLCRRRANENEMKIVFERAPIKNLNVRQISHSQYPEMVKHLRSGKSLDTFIWPFNPTLHPKREYLLQLLHELFGRVESKDVGESLLPKASSRKRLISSSSSESAKSAKPLFSTSKVIVFSEFEQSIRQMADALQESVSFHDRFVEYGRGVKQNKTLALFSDPKSGKDILLVTVKRGSTGLNLSAGNSIIFLEPFTCKADEMQAMNRIYDITKMKETQINYLILLGTIEERILESFSPAVEIKEEREIDEDLEVIQENSKQREETVLPSQNEKEVTSVRNQRIQTILQSEIYGRSSNANAAQAENSIAHFDFSLRGYKPPQ